jgi:nucleoside-diphosphate-sugar epimerase
MKWSPKTLPNSSVDFAPDLDRQNARFAPAALALLRNDTRRIVIVGAGGWIGRTLLALLQSALNWDEFARRVVCYGSAERAIVLDDGTLLEQKALGDLPTLLSSPTLLFHLAFLTKDKVTGMDSQAYCAANRALSNAVHAALEPIGVDRLFVASSGAAAFADDPDAADDLRLYGMLKREDEQRFAGWARDLPETRSVAIGRIYAVSGPWMNKHETYALASFILDALAGRPIAVRAPHRVLRSYVAVREVLSLVVAMLLEPGVPSTQYFSTGGDMLELGEVAGAVARLLGGTVRRNAISAEQEEDRYAGDDAAWTALLTRHRIGHLPLDDQIAETAAWLTRQNLAHQYVRWPATKTPDRLQLHNCKVGPKE